MRAAPAVAMVAASHALATHPPSLVTLVEHRLRDLVAAHDGVTDGSVDAVTLAPGQRLRAELVLTSARTVDLPESTAIELAAGIELVDRFSLVRDDIAGNALHMLAWSVMLDLDAPPERTLKVARLFALTLERMVAEQARDLVWACARRRDLRYTDYVEMVRGNTGALFAFAAASPAALAGHASAAALHQFGQELGIALQMNDVADLGGDGTERAIELAHHHVAQARKHLAATGLGDTTELDAFTELALPHPISLN